MGWLSILFLATLWFINDSLRSVFMAYHYWSAKCNICSVDCCGSYPTICLEVIYMYLVYFHCNKEYNKYLHSLLPIFFSVKKKKKQRVGCFKIFSYYTIKSILQNLTLGSSWELLVEKEQSCPVISLNLFLYIFHDTIEYLFYIQWP